MMEKILSRPMPHYMVRKTRTNYFDGHTGRLKWDPTAPEARYTNQHCKPLNQYGKQKARQQQQQQQTPTPTSSKRGLNPGQKHHHMFQSSDQLSAGQKQLLDNRNKSGSQLQLSRGSGPEQQPVDDSEDVELMYDLIARMLDYDPTARMNLREAVRHQFFDKLAQTHPRTYPGLDPELSRHILRLQI